MYEKDSNKFLLSKSGRSVDFEKLIRRMVESEIIKITGDYNEIHVVDLSRREALE